MKVTNSTRLGKYWNLSFALAALTLVYLVLSAPAAAQTSYTVTDLGTLGGTFGVGFGINNEGWIDGAANLPGDTKGHAFLWLHGLKIDLGTLGGPTSEAFLGPNERGRVVGRAETSTPDPNNKDFCFFGTGLIRRAFLWQNGVMTDLGTLGGNNSNSYDINNRDQVVGTAEKYDARLDLHNLSVSA